MQGFGGNLGEVEISDKNVASLDVIAAPKTRACPKCGTPHLIGDTGCGRCGVNFARHALQQQQAAQMRPRYTVPTDEEREHDQRARGNAVIEKAGKPPREMDVGLFLAGAVGCGLVAGLAWLFVTG